jgi:hypothetical protein
MSLATAAAIRNQVYSLLEALTPTTDATKFRRYRNEGGADFEAWAETHTTACFRRVQVRQVGADELPETSSAVEERVRMRMTLRIAYPQTHRYGAANAMDRDDVMNEDWLKINAAVGVYGAANFTGAYDCIPLGATMEMERGFVVDFLVVNIDVEYLRSVT